MAYSPPGKFDRAASGRALREGAHGGRRPAEGLLPQAAGTGKLAQEGLARKEAQGGKGLAGELSGGKPPAPTLQLWIAVLLVLAGLTLLYLGFWLPPEGEIHSSVLVAFGEASTFAGALFGVDYRYRKEGGGQR